MFGHLGTGQPSGLPEPLRETFNAVCGAYCPNAGAGERFTPTRTESSCIEPLGNLTICLIRSQRTDLLNDRSQRAVKLRGTAGQRSLQRCCCTTFPTNVDSDGFVAIRCLSSVVSSGPSFLAARAYSSSASASWASFSFHCPSRLSATSRFSGRTSIYCR
jgi:hypothetical protein